MSKRLPTSRLTQENWDNEDISEDLGKFECASKEVLASRQIKVAKRKCKFAEEGSAGLFKDFTGFSSMKSNMSSDFKFGNTSATCKVTAVKTATTSSNEITYSNVKTSNTSNDYVKHEHLAQLKSLNRAVLGWIQLHIEKNPYVVLNPIFKDYEKHLAKIEREFPYEDNETEVNTTMTSVVSTSSLFPSFISSSDNSIFSTVKSRDSGSSATAISISTMKAVDTSLMAGTSSFSTEKASDSSSAVGNSLFSFGKDANSLSTAGPSIFSFGKTADSSGSIVSSCAPTTFAGSSIFSSATNNIPFKFGSTTSSLPDTSDIPFKFVSKTTSNVGDSSLKPFSSLTSAAGSTVTSLNSTENEEEYVPPAPEVREIKEEGSVLTIRCKLFYMKEDEWRDKGIGNLHLKKVSDGKAQLIIRADTNLGNLLLNILLTKSTPLKQNKNSITLVCIPSPPVDARSSDKPVSMLVRVKTSEDAASILKEVENLLK